MLTVTPLIDTLAEMARDEYNANPGVESIAEVIFEMENGDEIVLEAKAKPTVKGEAKLYFSVDNQLIAKARLGEFLLNLGVVEPDAAPAQVEPDADTVQRLCDEAGIANCPENEAEINALVIASRATLDEVQF